MLYCMSISLHTPASACGCCPPPPSPPPSPRNLPMPGCKKSCNARQPRFEISQIRSWARGAAGGCWTVQARAAPPPRPPPIPSQLQCVCTLYLPMIPNIALPITPLLSSPHCNRANFVLWRSWLLRGGRWHAPAHRGACRTRTTSWPACARCRLRPCRGWLLWRCHMGVCLLPKRCGPPHCESEVLRLEGAYLGDSGIRGGCHAW